MTDPMEQGEHDRYERIRHMPLEEVTERLDDIRSTIDEVVGRYADIERPLSGLPDEEDNAKLLGCLGDLLPMGLNDAVQAELVGFQQGDDPTNLAFNRIGHMTQELMLFQSMFPDSGVEVYYGTDFLD